MARPVPAARKRSDNQPSMATKSPYLKNKDRDLNSDGEDDDESLSENELLADFNKTSSTKNNTKAKDTGFNPMMMTMKKPWQAATTKRPTSPVAHTSGLGRNKLGTVGENLSESEDDSDEDIRTIGKKPSFLRGQRERPKSPSVQGRQKSAMNNELVDDWPKPSPRQKHDLDKKLHNADDVRGRDLDRKTPPARKTPVDDRKSPIVHRKSPAGLIDSDDDIEDHSKSNRRKSPFSDGKKTPVMEDFRGKKEEKGLFGDSSGRKTPVKQNSREKKSSFDDDNDDKFPIGDGRKWLSKDRSRDQKSPFEGAKSPFGDGKRTLSKDHSGERRSPFDEDGIHFGNSKKLPSKDNSRDRASPLVDDNFPFGDPKKLLSKDVSRDRMSPFEQDRTHGARKMLSKDHSRDQKSPFGGDSFGKSSRHTSPVAERKTPVSSDRRKDANSPSLHRKGSVLDFLTETKQDNSLNFSSDDEERERKRRDVVKRDHGRQKSTSPGPGPRGKPVKETVNPFDKVHKSPVAEKKSTKMQKADSNASDKHSRPSSQTKVRSRSATQDKSDDESSVCEEFIEEPVNNDASSDEETATPSRQKSKQQSTTTRQKSEETIEMVRGAQGERGKMRYIEPANTDTKKPDRPPSAKGKVPVPVYKPKPRYVKPSVASHHTNSSPDISFDCTDKIRDVVFNEWKAKRAVQVKQEIIEKQKKQKLLEEKIEKEKRDKLENGKAAYQCWMEKKKDYVSEKEQKKRKEEEKAKMEEEKKRQKKLDAEMQFTKWKETADQKLQEEFKKTIRKEKEVEEDKKLTEQEKEEKAESAYRRWKADKEEQLKKQEIEQKHKKKQEKKVEKEAQKEHEKDALKAYETWLDKKEQTSGSTRRDSNAGTHTLADRNPWRPASRTIPFGRS